RRREHGRQASSCPFLLAHENRLRTPHGFVCAGTTGIFACTDLIVAQRTPVTIFLLLACRRGFPRPRPPLEPRHIKNLPPPRHDCRPGGGLCVAESAKACRGQIRPFWTTSTHSVADRRKI